MRITAIVQARMGSTRLPGKVLMHVGGETVLGRMVRRLQRASSLGQIVVATSTSPQDEAIVRECERLQVASFCGPEHDVLLRYFQAAEQFGADIVVRVTADCPLIDSAIVDDVVRLCLKEQADLACNELPRTFPRGLDVEVLTIQALRKASEISDQPYQREHVTPVIYERPDIFRIVSVRADRDFSRHRWTLDTAEDLQLIRAIYSHFDNRDDFTWHEVIELLEQRPDLLEINSHIVQKPVRQSASVF
jgi:spore coat polysaccharide biosynthesis protein SpsF